MVNEQVTVLPLLTPLELVEEGKHMQHCVGIYAVSCMQGRGQIYSLRVDGVRFSTLQTTVTRGTGGPIVRIAQHSGLANKKPPLACRKAADALIQYFRHDTHSLDKYLRWQATIAAKPLDERKMIAMTRPIAAAFETTLPNAWSLDRLLTLARLDLLRSREKG